MDVLSSMYDVPFEIYLLPKLSDENLYNLMKTNKKLFYKIFNFLNKYPNKINEFLFYSLNKKDLFIFYLFIKAGVNVNKFNNDGFTPLMLASINNLKIFVFLLINAGADLNIQDKNEKTALIYSVIYNNSNDYSIVKMLIQFGANINIYGLDGYTVLIWATNCKNGELVKILINAGVDVNYRDFYGYNAYFYSCEEITKKYLIEAGVETY